METTLATAQEVINGAQFFDHWQGHRSLTRKIIEAFPEKELFTFKIGTMRTFADMVGELLAIAAPGLGEIATGKKAVLNEAIDFKNSKREMLRLWDLATVAINQYWDQMGKVDFQQEHLSFGQFPGTVQSALFYFLDNEIHHRGQGYVYLRALDVEPPFFYDR